MESLSTRYDPSEVESAWYKRWEEAGYFAPQEDAEGEPFVITMPPPNVTGSLHMGHALFVTLQDLLTRWHRMAGDRTLWLPGTDHAGIATQMVVERDLLAKEGKSRHELGREAFLERVWEWKGAYGSRISEQIRTLGASCDWSRERFTMDEAPSYAVRTAFVQLHKEGLIYRDTRLINWCSRCHTALSDLEVDHATRASHLWHLVYPVEGSDQTLIVATTRPETMLGDTGVAVHPEDLRYQSLIGKRVVLPLVGRSVPIVADAVLVDMEFGSGAVKVTPAHDFNDFETGKRHDLEEISVIGLDGKINEAGGRFAGLNALEAREAVVAALDADGYLDHIEDHELSVGCCQRCGTVVEPLLSQQWFVKAKVLAAPAIEAVESGKTVFVPKSWEKTYFHWMRNIQDWCVSRQLWWGHRIPAWTCPEGHLTVAVETPSACSSCAHTELQQDEDVLDTWFSSGLWPFSTLGWPEKTADLAQFYPTAVMETGFDIIFFWVARMMMMGIHFMGEPPFKTIYLHAMVRDEKGQKMSKVKNNVIDPLDITEKYGSDALRFAMVSMAGQGRDIKLSIERVEGYRAFANKIWNAARFALMNLDDFEASDRALEEETLGLSERWLLTRLDRATEQMTLALENYRFDEAARLVYAFIWGDLCDWFIELSKPVLRGAFGEDARRGTQAVLVHVLDSALRLLHPIMPFVTEEIWQKLPLGKARPDSIMNANFPVAQPDARDLEAEEALNVLIEVISAVRAIRGESRVAPKTKVKVILHAKEEKLRGIFSDNEALLVTLCGSESLAISAPTEAPPKAAAEDGHGFEVYVPLEGIVDLDEEAGRLKKGLARAEKELAGLKGRLGNKGFLSSAPPEVVEESRRRVAELSQTVDHIAASLKRLGEASV